MGFFTKLMFGIYLFFVVHGRPDMIEEEILDEILYNYNKLARPGTIEHPTVKVEHGVNLIKIEECDGKTLKAMTWLPIAWTDPRLAWSLDFYDLDALTLPSDLLWTPDIVLYNSPSSHAGNAYNPRVYIFNSGSLSWYPPTTITTNCEGSEIDNTVIFCLMRFGSWSYHGRALDIVLSSDFVDTEDYIEHPEWEYVNSTAYKAVQMYACCPEAYPYVMYNITLRRRDNSQSYNVETNLPHSINGVIERKESKYNVNSDTAVLDKDSNTYQTNNTINGKGTDTGNTDSGGK
ncbi:neuronal acetylcholine receptor subunit alpha-9-II-like isoform X1 [Mytilus edulis]|uniref:neuronal acetylcholine receptor subunit alpha-9-II-like isoform X1 n=1 Tax=Mytilus edulis TaxID=6550 RepID=UPI0039F06C8E